MAFFARLTTLKMALENVVYISYLVPARRIRAHVPSVLPITSDNEGRTYISIVAMKCHRVRLSMAAWPRFDYHQLNLRTYVTDPKTGVEAVYFFHSGVSIGIVPRMTGLFGIPWDKIAFNLDNSSPSAYRASGNWLGEVAFEIESRADEALEESVVQQLTGPMMGFMGDGGSVRGFKINHRPLEVRSAVLNSIRFPLPVNQGLVSETELQKPDSVLIVPEAEFTVYLPPHRVPERG